MIYSDKFLKKWNSSWLQLICKWHANHLLQVMPRVKSAQNRLINSIISWTVTENSGIVWLFVVEFPTSNSRPSDYNFFFFKLLNTEINSTVIKTSGDYCEWMGCPSVRDVFIYPRRRCQIPQQTKNFLFFTSKNTMAAPAVNQIISRIPKINIFLHWILLFACCQPFASFNVSITSEMLMNSIKTFICIFKWTPSSGLSLTEKMIVAAKYKLHLRLRVKVSVEWRNEFFCFVKKFRKKVKRNMKMRETFELNEMKGGESGKSAEKWPSSGETFLHAWPRCIFDERPKYEINKKKSKTCFYFHI